MRDRLAHIYSAVKGRQGKASGFDLWNADPARANSSLAGMWEQANGPNAKDTEATFESPGGVFSYEGRDSNAVGGAASEALPMQGAGSASGERQVPTEGVARSLGTSPMFGTPESVRRLRASSALSTASGRSEAYAEEAGSPLSQSPQTHDPLRPKLGPDSEPRTSSGIPLQSRVIVNQRCGILRYVGNVHFEPGEWCGIELDAPSGKNNGSVGKLTYFVCQAKHGLFAPVAKVMKEPHRKGKTRSLLYVALRRIWSRQFALPCHPLSHTVSDNSRHSYPPMYLCRFVRPSFQRAKQDVSAASRLGIEGTSQPQGCALFLDDINASARFLGFADRWITFTHAPSVQAGTCCVCEAKFTKTRRRHHCRHCGGLCCQSCSPDKVIMPYLVRNAE